MDNFAVFDVTPAAQGMAYTGTYCYNHIFFQFTCNPQRSSVYAYRGTVSMLSPVSGLPMQLDGRARRDKISQLMDAHQCNEHQASKYASLKIKSEIHLTHSQISDKSDEQVGVLVKGAVSSAAKKLYYKHYSTLSFLLSNVNCDCLNPAQLFALHGDSYFKTQKKVKADTLAKKRRKIQSTLELFDDKQVSKLSVQTIKTRLKKLPGDGYTRIKEAAKFWDFCVCRGYVRSNPFLQFLEQQPDKISTKKDPILLVRRALRLKSIPTSVESNLIRRICDASCDDSCMTGILLLLECNMTPKEACALKIDDIFPDPDNPDILLIRSTKTNLASSTHLYIFPCSPLCSRELQRRLDGIQPGSPYLLAGLDATALAKYCKTALLDAGLTYNALLPDPAVREGVSTRLYNDNFSHKLIHYCGLDIHSGAYRYYRGLSMAGDVTNDHYNSFSSASGRDRLSLTIQRDGRFTPLPPDTSLQLDDTSDGCVLSVPPCDMDQKNAMSAEYILMPGESLCIKCHGGVGGNVSVTAARKPKKTPT